MHFTRSSCCYQQRRVTFAITVLQEKLSMSTSIKKVLILEPDQHFATRLSRRLAREGLQTVVVKPTVKEACLHLMQTSQDLAFIPVSEGAKIVRLLRAVQPDLRLILMTPEADVQMPETYAGRVQGVLIKSLMDVELPTILEKVFEQPLLMRGSMKAKVEKDMDGLDTAVLIATLNQARLGRLIQSVVFSRDTNMLVYWGELKEREAASVSIYAARNWGTGHKTRVQFVHLPARAGDLLLYTHHVMENFYLTLVALPETPLGELRTEAVRMVVSLKKIVMGRTAPLKLPEANTNVDGRTSYGLVWRPVSALPKSLFIPLRRALERLARANACVLTHILVEPDYVHVVVNCPPGRDSTWAAYLFKNGSEQTIQKQFGVAASLWETGFYAIEASDPLSETELYIFLEHDRVQ